jgi:hypothetical protein
MHRFKDKVVIVTGGGSGIGAGTVKRYRFVHGRCFVFGDQMPLVLAKRLCDSTLQAGWKFEILGSITKDIEIKVLEAFRLIHCSIFTATPDHETPRGLQHATSNATEFPLISCRRSAPEQLQRQRATLKSSGSDFL